MEPTTTNAPGWTGVTNGPTLVASTARVELRPFTVHRPTGAPPFIEVVSTGRRLEVSEETILALELIQRSPTLAAAEEALAEKLGEPYDLSWLATRLRDRGFVARIDGEEIEHARDARAEARRPTRTLGRLHDAATVMGSLLRSKATLAIVGLLVIQHIVFVATTPEMRVRFSDLFLFGRISLNIIGAMAGGLVVAFLHELGHYAVAASYGLRPKIGLSHRLHILVMTTDVSDAWRLPKRQQIAIFGAGILVNAILAATFGTLLALGVHGTIEMAPATIAFLRFAVALNTIPLLFQLIVTMRTDLYYMLQTALGRHNLAEDAQRYIRMRIIRIAMLARGKPASECNGCGGPVFAAEPFCVACGTAKPVRDPNNYPFQWKDRHILLAFGALTVVVGLLVYPLMVFTMLRLLVFTTLLAGTAYVRALDHEWLVALELVAAIALLGLQLSFAVGRVVFLVIDGIEGAFRALARFLFRVFPETPHAFLNLSNFAIASYMSWRRSRSRYAVERVRHLMRMSSGAAATGAGPRPTRPKE